ncbi:IclR family transcriptional regulator [Halomarina oriensis]|uniref:Helix-turn-helix domain-containing protein n=1 Tax=Halomarina oriensis TaxID=671145 RepID=A0A6B0GL30_9EURY|nr:IclR family transcriptional regulator [Halomarina oriensis]MWG33503.1 helix-turn-helix domain-containing protein [Halomarina oriensis]
MATRQHSDNAGSRPVEIKSVKTSFRIIEAMKSLEEPSVTELAAHTDLAKSTVHKHLKTLEHANYVTKNDDVYRLGARFLDLGGYVREDCYGVGRIKQQIKELAEETGEVAHFAVHEHGRAIVLYRESGRQGVPTRSRIGKRMYLHQTAYGKAILAHLPEAEIEEIVARVGLPTATDSTITDRTSLIEELETVRERGYAINDEESTMGLRAIGAPVHSTDGEVFGACSIAGPKMPIDESTIDPLIRMTKQFELEMKYSR